MPESIDWPNMRAPRRRRRFLLLVIAALAVIVLGGRAALSYYVDLLWFDSLGYRDVFWKTLGLQWGIFTAFAAATFLILYGSFLVLKRTHLPDLPSGRTIFIGGQPLKLPVEPVLRLIAVGLSLVIAVATGAGVMLEWPTIALFWCAAPAAGGFLDPVFGKPLHFFLFSLPGWQLIVGWLLALALMTCVLAVFFILITDGIRAFLGRSRTYVTLPWRGLSVTFAFLLLILAARVYLGRFEQLFDVHTIFAGVTYSDAHIMLPGMLAVCAALILGAVIASANAVRVPRGRWIAAAILPAALCYVCLLGVGWYVSSFIVKPNELVREQPYITHNIELTRQAYGLDRVSQLDQREADLHPWLWNNDEPSKWVHAGRAAHADSEQHACPEHGAWPNCESPRGLFRRADQHRCLREDAAEGIQLPARPNQQPNVLRRQRGHRARRASALHHHCVRPRRPCKTAVQR